MKDQTHVNPWWAALTVWGVVNAVNVLQSAGFLSRVVTGSLAINHLLGLGVIALAIPAALAFVAFIRARAGVLLVSGGIVNRLSPSELTERIIEKTKSLSTR